MIKKPFMKFPDFPHHYTLLKTLETGMKRVLGPQLPKVLNYLVPQNLFEKYLEMTKIPNIMHSAKYNLDKKVSNKFNYRISVRNIVYFGNFSRGIKPSMETNELGWLMYFLSGIPTGKT